MQTDWAVLSLSGDPYAGGTNTASEVEQLGQGSAVLALVVCHLCAPRETYRPSGYALTLLVVIPSPSCILLKQHRGPHALSPTPGACVAEVTPAGVCGAMHSLGTLVAPSWAQPP